MECSVKLFLKDLYGNLITTPNLLTDDDVDTLVVGPYNSLQTHETLYVQSIDNSESTSGIYYLYFKRYYVGDYYLYIRLRSQLAPDYPFYMQVITTSIYSGNTKLVTTGYENQTVGTSFTMRVLAKDMFNNIVTAGTGVFS